jgi:acetate kinase
MNTQALNSQDAILVINCGSSSVKFSLILPTSGKILLSGLAERLLTSEAKIKIQHSLNDDSDTFNLASPYNHQCALTFLVERLQQLNLVEGIIAIGHRIVHGGEQYALPTLITDDVIQTIERLTKLAPLHNPANLVGVKACQAAFVNLAQVAIFDTAFHQTMPEKAYLYGLPYELYKKHGIRRYGFHGTSHYFVAMEAAKIMAKPLEQCHLISAHLGNGCSVSAIKNGKSVDTSLGMTPLEGVMMGTRSGDVDPGIIFYLVEQLKMPLADVEKMLNTESGLLGVSQLSNDCRTLEAAMFDNDPAKAAQAQQATIALTVFCYKIAKSIASFSASLTSLDGLIFTGGIGENSSWVREQIINQLSLLNFQLSPTENQLARFGQSGIITQKNSRPCWVIPTNEEWVIAQQSFQLLQQLQLTKSVLVNNETINR